VALGNLATVLYAVGKIDEALACFRECVRVRRLLGNKAGEVRAFLEMAEMLLFVGRTGTAREEAERILGAAARGGHASAIAAATLVQARVLRAEDPARARVLLEEAMRLAQEEKAAAVLDRAILELLLPETPELRFLVGEEEHTRRLEAYVHDRADPARAQQDVIADALRAVYAARHGDKEGVRRGVSAVAHALPHCARDAWCLDAILLTLLCAVRLSSAADLELVIIGLAEGLVPIAQRTRAKSGFWTHVGVRGQGG
jgi:tetratricopeptide (TPR) repeat protein